MGYYLEGLCIIDGHNEWIRCTYVQQDAKVIFDLFYLFVETGAGLCKKYRVITSEGEVIAYGKTQRRSSQ